MSTRLPGIAAIVVLLAFSAGAVESSPANIGPVEAPPPRLALAPGDPVPVLRGIDAEGRSIELEYADSKLTLVQFWISTCGPCAAMLAPLEAIRARFDDRGLRVVSVLLDPKRYPDVQPFLTEAGAKFPVLRARLVDADREWGGLRVAPVTFLIGKDGKLVRRYVGGAPEQLAGLGEDVEAALAGRILPMQVVPEVEAVTATLPQ